MRLFTFLSAFILCSVNAAAGQTALLVTPFAGGAFFLSDFESRNGLRDVGVVGAHAEMTVTPRLAVRLHAAWAPSAIADITGQDDDVDVVFYGGALVYGLPGGMRSRPRTAIQVYPYFLAGLGGKTYRFDGDAEDTTDATLSLGGGVLAPVSERLGLRLEAIDHVSDADGLQHDVLLTVGATIRVR